MGASLLTGENDQHPLLAFSGPMCASGPRVSGCGHRPCSCPHGSFLEQLRAGRGGRRGGTDRLFSLGRFGHCGAGLRHRGGWETPNCDVRSGLQGPAPEKVAAEVLAHCTRRCSLGAQRRVERSPDTWSRGGGGGRRGSPWARQNTPLLEGWGRLLQTVAGAVRTTALGGRPHLDDGPRPAVSLKHGHPPPATALVSWG